MSAASNAIVNVTPSANFYITAQSCSTGSVIDSISAIETSAKLNFSSHNDCFGAIVTHCQDGRFTVNYANANEFASLIERETQSTLPEHSETLSEQLKERDTEVMQLKQQLEELADMVKSLQTQEKSTSPFPRIEQTVSRPSTSLSPALTDNTISDPYPVKRPSTWYEASFNFQNKPGQSRRRDLRDRLISYMQTLGYVYEGGSIDSKFVAIWSHDAGSYGKWHSTAQTTQDLRNVCQALPRHLKGFIDSTDLNVVRTAEAKGLWRARGETESRSNEYEMTRSDRSSNTGSASDTSDSVTSDVQKMNGSNGVSHDKKRSKRGSRSMPMGEKVQINGQRTPTGAVKSSGMVNAQMNRSTDIDAAKTRAMAVLQAEGLGEWAVKSY